MTHNTLTALPVYNEAKHIATVLNEVVRYSENVLVINDGSRDATAEILAARRDIEVVTHVQNQGYGAALSSAFEFALLRDYDVLVTIDCDGQHEPQRIPEFVRTCIEVEADIVSGSRYLRNFTGDSRPPEDRRRINRIITREISERLGLRLTDAFCGFKAYRVPALAKLHLTEAGYAMPLELWAQAAEFGLRIVELPVPLIYLEEERSFGGSLDDAEIRLDVYRQVLERSLREAKHRSRGLAGAVAAGEDRG